MRKLHFPKSTLPTWHCFSTSSAVAPRPTKKDCIFHLKNCKSINQAKEVHNHMFKIGLQQDRDTVSKLMVFATDPILGDSSYSEKVFDSLDDPTLLVYNLMLKAYVKNGSFRKAMALFRKLRAEGWWPDDYTYPFVLKAVGRLGDVGEGLKIHGSAVKTWLFGFDVYVGNSLMDMYAVLGHVEVMRKVFDEMSVRDTVSWNVLISGYVKCRRFHEAVYVFQRMRRELGVKPEEATIVSTLSACVGVNDLELGKEIHHYVNKEMKVTTRIENALVDMYGKCGCPSCARGIFDSMKLKNVICWTSMVTAYTNCGQLDEARFLFDHSPDRDLILWTAMINGYVQFNQFSEALELFREMQAKQVKPDKFTLVSLLTGCAQLGSLEQGQWLHGYINEHKFPMDVVLSTALVEMYAKCGCIDKSIGIFDRIREKDTASWTSIICGLAANGKTTQALEYFSRMTQTGVKPDDITFIGVLSACNHGGLVEQGRKYFALMTNIYNIEPKVEHYGCLIDLLGRAGQLDRTEELIKTIPCGNNSLLVPVFGALLSACRMYGNFELGEQLAERLALVDSNDSGIHSLVANMYASSNRWEDAVKARKRMKADGVVKVPGCSSVEIDGVIHEFLVGDCSHREIAEIKYTMVHTINPLLLAVEDQQILNENNIHMG